MGGTLERVVLVGWAMFAAGCFARFVWLRWRVFRCDLALANLDRMDAALDASGLRNPVVHLAENGRWRVEEAQPRVHGA